MIDWESGEPVVMGQFPGDLPEEVEGCILFQTSGSSGRQKWVALHRRALWWSAERVVEHLQMTEQDVCCLVIPTFHVGGFGLRTRAAVCGAREVFVEGKWDAETFLAQVEREEVSLSSLVPTQVVDLVRTGKRCPESVRGIVVGGGELSAKLRVEAESLGWPVLPSYGMTETGSQIATGVGLPLISGWRVRSREGMLEVSGEGLFQGYVTPQGFLDPKVDGWFLTSDRGKVEEGKLTIFGRCDRQVKVLGELVDLDELERWWKEKLRVELALVALPEERRGHRLYLVTEGKGRDAWRTWNEELIGPARVDGRVTVQSLPRSGIGKVDRGTLEQQIWAQKNPEI